MQGDICHVICSVSHSLHTVKQKTESYSWVKISRFLAISKCIYNVYVYTDTHIYTYTYTYYIINTLVTIASFLEHRKHIKNDLYTFKELNIPCLGHLPKNTRLLLHIYCKSILDTLVVENKT